MSKYVVNFSQAGNTVDNGVTVVIDARNFDKTATMMKNTGGSSLTVSIISRVLLGGVLTSQEVGATVLTSMSTINYVSNDPVSTVEISVSSTTPGAPTSFLIESLGRVGV